MQERVVWTIIRRFVMFLEFWDRFFLYTDLGMGFASFTRAHLLASLIFAVLPVAIVILLKDRIRRLRHESFLGIGLGVLGLSIEFLQYYWHYHGGQIDWRHIYPTTLCGLTLYISSIAMITRNVKLAQIAYFYSYGAFFSFLFAEVSHGADRFRFYAYFVIHGLILVNATYQIAVYRVRADKEGLANAVRLFIPVLALSFILNHFFSDGELQLNFFYLSHPPFEFPVFSQLYDIHWLLYAAAVCISYNLLFLIMYGIARWGKFDRIHPRELRDPEQLELY
jgi:hypothetical integral membrane protein (TIGR02206 family)